jgi:hypothetical protein
MGVEQQMTRDEKAIMWIERFCITPRGFDKGQRVRFNALARAHFGAAR